MSAGRFQALRWGWLLAGLCSLYAAPAAAEHLTFLSELRYQETPNATTGPSAPFAFYSETRSDGLFDVSQTSVFATNQFVGNGSASAPIFAPGLIPDPVAANKAGFEFSVAETTEVRFEGTAYATGTTRSDLDFRRISPTAATLVDECAGWLCNMTVFFPETKTVDSVFTLTPGTYSVSAHSYTDARGLSPPGVGTWSLRFTSPLAVPVAGWTRVGMITSLLLAGLAGIRRRNLHPLRQW